MSRIWVPRDRRKPFTEELRRPSFWVVLVLLLFFGDWMGKSVVFDPPAKWLGDILLRTRRPHVPRFTRFVQIDEADRDKVLLGKTPVDGAALVRAVCGLAASKPRVLVVDIDTSSAKSFPNDVKVLPDFHGVEVIWAVNADWENVQGKLKLTAGRFLGGHFIARFSIARMPVGFDGLVREWYRSIEVNGVPETSLTERAAQLHCRGRSDCPVGYEPSLTVDYLFPPMHLSEFVPELKAPQPPQSGGKPLAMECAKEDSLRAPDKRLEGMMVVLGAVHPHEDRHDTPWGTKAGAELVAMTIEESLGPHAIGHLYGPVKWGLKVGLAIGIAALHHFFWPIAATFLTALVLPVGVLVSGLAVFWFGDYHLATVPLVVGILLEQLATSAEKGEHHARHGH